MFNDINGITEITIASILLTDLTQFMSGIVIMSFITIISFLVVVSSNDTNIHIDTINK